MSDLSKPLDERRRTPPSALALDREDTLLLVVDIQERLAAAMPPEGLARVVKNTRILLETAKTFGLPVIVTEQYPKGLGPTLAELKEALPEEVFLSDKVAFSCGAVEAVARRIFESGRRQIIVAGMESHVCVFQTVRDLAAGGYAPFVPGDAVLSRTAENHAVGLSLMKEAGATLSSTEALVFDLLGAAGSPAFKRLSPLVK